MRTYLPGKGRWNSERRINPYITEARARERFWHEFRIEMELIGARLCKVRHDRGYSINAAAGALRVSKNRLAMIERGVYKHFQLPHLYLLCQLYGVTTVDILSIIPDACFEGVEYWKYRSRRIPD